jgi:Trypsin-like peptidase domain
MTSRSKLLTCLSVVIAALVLIVLRHTPPAHADDPPECIGYWPNPDSCFPDILCDAYAEFWDVRRAVVHISGPDIEGTGVLINNAFCDAFDQQCGKPYILTAQHVVSDQEGKMTNGEKIALQNETMFTFGLEAAWCGGKTAGGAIAVKGASVVAESPERDLVLLQLYLNLPQELGAYFVGWGKGDLYQAIAIGHPCLAPKRIAISEPKNVVFKKVVDKVIYIVDRWEIGALADGSSGSPLLDMNTGSLHGVYTNADGAGALTCFEPDLDAVDVFTALTSILDTLPESVDRYRTSIDPYDSDPYISIADTVEDSSYYGPGEIKTIKGKHEVWLVSGFHADKGSEIVIEVNP